MYLSGEGGRKTYHMTPDLSYDWKGDIKRKAKIIKGIEKKRRKSRI